mmetsp:Transcript_25815/g.53419  ORF Transcript_25815/g.53419 Transcript_25815/m.53419 type:complete len:87 (+) Transcript_25815:1-261(+)
MIPSIIGGEQIKTAFLKIYCPDSIALFYSAILRASSNLTISFLSSVQYQKIISFNNNIISQTILTNCRLISRKHRQQPRQAFRSLH